MPDERLRAAAEACGPLPSGHFRVIVECGDRVSHFDSEQREAACGYADDAVGEFSDSPVVAVVFDATWAVVHRGRAYYQR